jgi:phosphatidylglycerol:prolipoprotein diacylglycerol transferase
MAFIALRHHTFHTKIPFHIPFDACLAALIGGSIGARLGYALLNWELFASQPDAILNFRAGGLNWHGAVMGGGIAFAGMIHWQKLNPRLMWDSAAWCLPLMAFAAWWGCWQSACAFGAEVVTLANYPTPFVWEARDLTNMIAPRFATQPIGMFAAFWLWIGLGFISWRGAFVGRRFPLMLAGFALSMVFIGYLRGDSAQKLMSVRFDQLLDIGLLFVASLWLGKPTNSAPQTSAPTQA